MRAPIRAADVEDAAAIVDAGRAKPAKRMKTHGVYQDYLVSQQKAVLCQLYLQGSWQVVQKDPSQHQSFVVNRKTTWRASPMAGYGH